MLLCLFAILSKNATLICSSVSSTNSLYQGGDTPRDLSEYYCINVSNINTNLKSSRCNTNTVWTVLTPE